jgi:uncharacterized protein
MIEIGTIQTMVVDRKIDTGYVLKKDMTEALLHHNESDKQLEIGEEVDVFLYQDKKGNLTASTKLPEVVMDNYGWAKVVSVLPHLGAFVDIGTTKEFLVSKDDLPLFENVWPKEEDMLFVTLGKDRKGRLLAIPATEGIFQREFEEAPDSLLNQTINGRVYHTSREGTAVITDEKYRGFIHHTERKTEPRLGELVQGRVIEVRFDGTLNLSLRPLKQHGMVEDADMILQHIKNHDGVIPLSDQSDPEDIRGTFHISKSAFKRALGKLMKDGKVEQRDGKTYLK